MDYEQNKSQNVKGQSAASSMNTSAGSMSGTHTSGSTGSTGSTSDTLLKEGSEAYDQAEQAVGEAYDKTARKVSETYEQAKEYTSHNQGKSLLIALGIGVGIGLLLGASSSSSYRSRTSRFAQPVVNALSDIAQEFFR